MKTKFLLLVLTLLSLSVVAQPGDKFVRVTVKPNSADWTYKLGDKVQFDVLVTRNSIPVTDVKVRYELSYDMMSPFESKTVTLKDGTIKINGGTMKTAGFLRCRVFATYEGKEYEGLATAGYAPETIAPTAVMPSDFQEFWSKAIEDNKKIPLDARLRLLPDRSTEQVNVYELNIQNYQYGARLYGILCVPTKPGKYPAKLKVPGAGVRAYNGDIKDAENGIITLEIGIHGIPVTMDNYVYENLRKGALKDYETFNWDDRDKVYYKRVYLGCVKAIDYIFTMDQFDGENLLVIGGSQGGALSIATAALDNRVKGLISYYPGLSDLTGYTKNRAGGWPPIFKDSTEPACILEKKIETSRYFDVVNFARILKTPGFYTFGYNDMDCSPTSIYAAYNLITAPKTLVLVQETGHYTYPEQRDKSNDFANTILKK